MTIFENVADFILKCLWGFLFWEEGPFLKPFKMLSNFRNKKVSSKSYINMEKKKKLSRGLVTHIIYWSEIPSILEALQS